MSDHLSIPIPKGIQEAIIKNKLVLFIGSGMSQQLGFPSWRNLTNDILDQLSQENPKYIKLKDSLEAGFETDLEALGKVYGLRSQVLEILDRTFSINYEALDLRLHRKLGLISSKIITTNYDKALEHANPSFKKIKHNDEYRLSKLPETNGFILNYMVVLILLKLVFFLSKIIMYSMISLHWLLKNSKNLFLTIQFCLLALV